jgi:hypothetical protein
MFSPVAWHLYCCTGISSQASSFGEDREHFFDRPFQTQNKFRTNIISKSDISCILWIRLMRYTSVVTQLRNCVKAQTTRMVISGTLVSCGGVGLSPLGTSAIISPTVICPVINYERGALGRMRTGRGNQSIRRKLLQCHFVHLPTTNSTWPEPGSNPGRSCGKAATNSLAYGTTYK